MRAAGLRRFSHLAYAAALACGTSAVDVVKPLPPNTKDACARLEQCRIFMHEQRDACLACLEHVDKAMEAELVERFGPLPPLEQVDCSTLARIAGTTHMPPARNAENITLAECVVGRRYGP